MLWVKGTVLTLMERSQPLCWPRCLQCNLATALRTVPGAEPAVERWSKICHSTPQKVCLSAQTLPLLCTREPLCACRAGCGYGQPGSLSQCGLQGLCTVGHRCLWSLLCPPAPSRCPPPATRVLTPLLPSLAAAMEAALIFLCSLLVPVAVADGRCQVFSA